jgi:hypothetical protein
MDKGEIKFEPLPPEALRTHFVIVDGLTDLQVWLNQLEALNMRMRMVQDWEVEHAFRLSPLWQKPFWWLLDRIGGI